MARETVLTRITVLVDNCVLPGTSGLRGEHGLAMLVETGDATVLFDTGQSALLLANAARLGVDLSRIRAVVLSHGHLDHTGGLSDLLGHVGGRPVHAHPDALAPKFVRDDGEARDIGLPASRSSLERRGAEFALQVGPVEVVPGVLATGPIPRVTDFETVHARFRRGPEADAEHDCMADDQSLLVQTDAGPVLLLGCAHAGLLNTLFRVRELGAGTRLAAVIGGTHLVDAGAAQLRRTVAELAQFEVNCLAAGHCTGLPGQVALATEFGARFAVHGVGRQYVF